MYISFVVHVPLAAELPVMLYINYNYLINTLYMVYLFTCIPCKYMYMYIF